jgi:hypothetical protein
MKNTILVGSGVSENFMEVLVANCRLYVEQMGRNPEIVRVSYGGRFKEYIGQTVEVAGQGYSVTITGGEPSVNLHTVGLK